MYTKESFQHNALPKNQHFQQIVLLLNTLYSTVCCSVVKLGFGDGIPERYLVLLGFFVGACNRIV